jgi:TetR/AcrR family transcriptional repressor of nem operon
MRRSQEDTAKTRARIVAAAAELFRARGIEATSVADVMSAVGLTVGGFYRHFDSKDALVVEAIERASQEVSARAPGGLETYLSDAHRRHPGRGCPVAALCSEVARGSKTTRAAFTDALERLLASVEAALPAGARSDRRRVLFAASAAVGALVLARATHDESLSDELLSAVREGLGERDGANPRRARREPPGD